MFRDAKRRPRAPASHRSPEAMDAGEDTPGRTPSRGSWADIPAEIIGTVLDMLPCLADRARLRSVCSPWRAAARLHRPLPPLPLIVLFKFEFSSFSSDGGMTAIRRIPLPEAVDADDVRCVGSYEGWLVGVQPSKYCRYADGECFLLNPFSQAVVRLPPPCTFHFFDSFITFLPVVNDHGNVAVTIHAREYAMSFNKVVLSASPDSRSKCIVAALSLLGARSKLAFWRHGMTSWCVCQGRCIRAADDLAFHHGKLYTVSNYNSNVYVYELGEVDRGVLVSHVKLFVIEPVPPIKRTNAHICNLVEWHGKLLYIIRYFDGLPILSAFQRIVVFALDFSANPCRLTKINSLDGDCIFISCINRSFPAYQYPGVEDDCIYFADGSYGFGDNARHEVPYIYNMKDGTVARFTIGPSDDDNFVLLEGHTVWFFPPE